MLFSQVQALMRQRGEALLGGRFDTLTATYRFPMPLFLRRQRIVVQDRDEATGMLAMLQGTLAESGVRALLPQVRAMDIPRSGRFRVWLDWHTSSPRVPDSLIGSMVYFLQAQGSDFRFEMVACNHLSMPGLAPRLVTMARCA